MLSTRVVQLIEDHAEQITKSVLAAIRKDPRLPLFGRLANTELLRRFEDVCQNLGRWLTAKDEAVIEVRYELLGRERFEEDIPLHECVLAAQIFKRQLLAFARRQAIDQSVLEIYSLVELERLLGGFFDQVIYHIVQGYERALRDSVQQTA